MKTSTLPKIQPLTSKEKLVLVYIETLLSERGMSPSYQEIKDHFGFASFNSVQNYLKQLQNKGYIQNPPHQKRAIQVLHPSGAVQENIRSLREEFKEQEAATVEHELQLPLMGKVAAGRPLEALTDHESISVPRSLVRNPDKSFVLQVVGSSMIEDGILDGDFILVQKQNVASNGETVIATVDQESTVKRFFQRNQNSQDKQIELRPANSSMQPMWYPAESVRIQGVVVGLIRKF